MDTIAHRFLARVLPDEGFYCALVVEGDRKWQRFFPTTGELADFILEQDALGRTVYHACASFRTVESRKGINAQGAQAFWLDVDARSTHATAFYADATEAAAAVDSFCRSVNFPTPIYVGSGGGVYAIWPWGEVVLPDTWRTWSTRLKLLCNSHGLQVDQVRTSDISSVLRTPGTHNRKGGLSREVQCGPLVGPYSIEQFGALNVGQRTVNFEAVRGNQAAYRRAQKTSIIDKCINLYGEPDADADLVAERCQVIGSVCDRPGEFGEPVIYASLGVISHCREGTSFALSIFDPQWHAEVQKKIAQQEAFGPTTCGHFESLNPKGCEGCPHKGKITSPIQLGRQRDECQDSGSRRETISNDIRAVEASPVREETETRPPLPEGFIINEQGLCHVKEDKNGEPIHVLVSSAPIYLQSVQTSEVDDHSFSLVFGLLLPRGRRSITIHARSLFSASGISEITGQGAIIHDADLFKKYVRMAVDDWHKQKDVDLRYDQFGWKDEDRAFLWGRRLYCRNTVHTVVGSPEVEHRSQFLQPAPGGSLERWSAAANQFFAAGLEPQSFGLLCAFGAPLMRFHTREEGGAIVSFVSDQSGSGKTTTLEAAASVWGRLKGTKLADNDTKVAQGLKLGVMGNLPCTYDELASRDPEIIRQFVLMFTGGQDKDRGRSDGTLIHAKAEWQTILLLASNKPLVDILSNLDGTDAPAFRLLEFNTDLPAGTDVRKGDQLRRELAANSGWAGDAFLRALVQPEIIRFVSMGLPTWTDQIWKRTKLRPEHRFWVRTAASVIAAATIVQRYQILDFSVQRITNWICDYLSERANTSTVTGARSESDILADFISRNLKNTLVVAHGWKPKVILPPITAPKDNLFLRYEREEGNLFIQQSVLTEYLLKRGVHRNKFDERLREQGVIKGTNKHVTLGAGTEYASGQSICYQIDMHHPLLSGSLRAVQENLIDAEMWIDTKAAREKRRIDELAERRKK